VTLEQRASEAQNKKEKLAILSVGYKVA
jgi:hypothetical protein